jgi:hypothetical protein
VLSYTAIKAKAIANITHALYQALGMESSDTTDAEELNQLAHFSQHYTLTGIHFLCF